MRASTVRPALAGLLLLLAACTGSAPGAPGTSPGGPPASVTAPPPAPSATPAQPSPTAVVAAPSATVSAPVPSAPPTALLGSAGSPAVPGELGSYTWQDGGSDAPWIIVPARHAARVPPPLRIDLEPRLDPVSWIVVWAPIERGLPGTIAGHAQGSGGTIAFPGPDGQGPWSLRLEADFGTLGRATWYWRLVPGS